MIFSSAHFASKYTLLPRTLFVSQRAKYLMENILHRSKMFQGAKCSKGQSVQVSKLFQGSKCVEKQNVLTSKVWVCKVFWGAKCVSADWRAGSHRSGHFLRHQILTLFLSRTLLHHFNIVVLVIIGVFACFIDLTFKEGRKANTLLYTLEFLYSIKIYIHFVSKSGWTNQWPKPLFWFRSRTHNNRNLGMFHRLDL